ncbi:AAA domain-containing protein [Lactifluus subvellereus]|nr:AAA domain-containing protein [Lactifluus subvellereus]
MIPILSFSNASTNVILAGDPRQLGPVIKSPIAARSGLRKSYLERLMHIEEVYGLDKRVGETIVDLQRNRRSHGAIIAWPNRWLYEDRMRASASADVTHLFLSSVVLPKKGFPVVFHGIKGGERRSKYSPSYFNIYEAFIVRDYCKKLTTDPERKIYQEDIGIIAPYRAQVRTIREVLKLADLKEIEVGSVEQFQGQERKVIILSTTRSNSAEEEPKLGFVQDRRRLNVAITRAQALLIVIGDPEVLGQDALWRTFLNYIILGGGQAGKGPHWNPKHIVRVPKYITIPRKKPVYGEGFINGKSVSIYKYLGE